MKRIYFFAVAFLFANPLKASGQTVRVPLTLDRWDTIKPDKEDTASIKINALCY